MALHFSHCQALLVAIWTFSSATRGLYLITDYFLDQDQSAAFLGACKRTLRDDCIYLNSHVNTFQLASYGGYRNCWVVLDAGPTPGARFHLHFLKWNLEPPVEPEGFCKYDYLELYDGNYGNNSAPFGRYCGSRRPNITGLPSQRYLSMKFVTSEVGAYPGFKIMAVISTPPPCSESQFLCPYESRCITDRLRCDGTAQCQDAHDESNCTTLERVLGGLAALGMAGMIGVGMGLFFICLLLCVLCSCCCCSRAIHPDKNKKNNRKKPENVTVTTAAPLTKATSPPGAANNNHIKRKIGGPLPPPQTRAEVQERWEELISARETSSSRQGRTNKGLPLQYSHSSCAGQRNSYTERPPPTSPCLLRPQL